VEQGNLSDLKAEIELLSTLLESAYIDYLFLRPVMSDAGLKNRMEKEGKLEGFNQIGEALYWWFIQQLVKIWDDRDSQDRHVSIRKILRNIADYRIVQQLEDRHARWMMPHGELPDPETFNSIKKREQQEQRDEFRSRLDRVLSKGAALLTSEPLQAYRRVRNKLIAHTEVHKGEAQLKRYPIENLRLKFGTERELLRNTIRIVHELQSLVCGVDFSWESLRSLYEPDVAAFWEVAELDDLCP
jgi:AbiU2